MKAINMGSEVHNKIVICRLEKDMFVGSSIVLMYAKCGLLSTTWNVFNKAGDAVLWNAMP